MTVTQVYTQTTDHWQIEVDWLHEYPNHLELTPKEVLLELFIIGDWNTKVGCQEKPKITGKFGFCNTK